MDTDDGLVVDADDAVDSDADVGDVAVVAVLRLSVDSDDGDCGLCDDRDDRELTELGLCDVGEDAVLGVDADDAVDFDELELELGLDGVTELSEDADVGVDLELDELELAVLKVDLDWDDGVCVLCVENVDPVLAESWL